ncbi:MAG: outer membrane protein assembly factor BamB [Planctomycetota bacterium]|jgi:outer membrane protein assembly factor BamB
MARFERIISTLVVALLLTSVTEARHKLVTQGNGKLAIVDTSGGVVWEMPWGGIHDIHTLENGNILVQQGSHKVVEIELATRSVVWTYDSSKQNGNEGRAVEVHAFQPLEDGRLMIAESGPARIIEIDRKGTLLHEIKLKVDHPHPHMDTRLVRKLASGNYLVCHEGDGAVREYEGKTGKLVWEYPVPLFGREPKGGHGPESFGNKVFGAVRLASGNTLIATGNGHSVLEVSPDKEVVWKLEQDELEGVRLSWVTTLEVLPNGHYVIGNCHAGPGQPLLIEIEPKTKRVIWKLDMYDTFGNSVPNSKLLDVGDAVR